MAAGVSLEPFTIAYQTYGALNADKSNAILLCHALTGDQHVANSHPLTGKPGWWSALVGPGRPFDTDKYFIICSNVLGGCMGTTGPASINPATGKPYGLDLPMVTIARHGPRAGHADRPARHRHPVLRRRRLDGRHAGAAMGGALSGARVFGHAHRHRRAPFLAEHRLPRGRPAGDHGRPGLARRALSRARACARPRDSAVARMAAHITYLSDEALQRKFGRKLQDRAEPTFSFDADFQVENYLRHQGSTFVDRFDANSYLYVTRACDYFDLAEDYGGSLAPAFKGSKTRFCVVSFTSDWLYTTAESRAIVHALNAGGGPVSFVEIATDKGHDAFLLDEPDFIATTRGFLRGAARARGLSRNRGARNRDADRNATSRKPR